MADDSADLVRAVMLVKMRRNGASWRWLERVLREPMSTLRSRYDTLPPDVREFYARTPLDFLT